MSQNDLLVPRSEFSYTTWWTSWQTQTKKKGSHAESGRVCRISAQHATGSLGLSFPSLAWLSAQVHLGAAEQLAAGLLAQLLAAAPKPIRPAVQPHPLALPDAAAQPNLQLVQLLAAAPRPIRPAVQPHPVALPDAAARPNLQLAQLLAAAPRPIRPAVQPHPLALPDAAARPNLQLAQLLAAAPRPIRPAAALLDAAPRPNLQLARLLAAAPRPKHLPRQRLAHPSANHQDAELRAADLLAQVAAAAAAAVHVAVHVAAVHVAAHLVGLRDALHHHPAQLPPALPAGCAFCATSGCSARSGSGCAFCATSGCSARSGSGRA